jgi:ribosomal protein S21
MEKRFKPNRPSGFRGYYVEIRPGEDAVRAYRKIKRKIKDDKFIEELRDRQYFQKPSFKKRERAKARAKVLRKLQRERDDNRFMGVRRK